MKKSSKIILTLIVVLCLIGIFTGGAISLVTLIIIGAISALLLFVLFHFIAAPKASGYKKAVKQSKQLRRNEENRISKKKKSSFKVIDGGKK
ncbi:MULTISPECIES: hypothetical protein [Listeria]|uniref:hypothetical protein n=1 Tax=Listeria TaxID=1637 RepID=UPI000B58B594|nr:MULTISPECIES: hypothetical protein [Listeria]